MNDVTDKANGERTIKAEEQSVDFLDILDTEIEKFEKEIKEFNRRKKELVGKEKFSERLKELTGDLPEKKQKEYKNMMKDLFFRAKTLFLGADYQQAEKAVNILRKMRTEFSDRMEEVKRFKEKFLEEIGELVEQRKKEEDGYGEMNEKLLVSTRKEVEELKDELKKAEQELEETISLKEYLSLKKKWKNVAKKNYYLGGAEEYLNCQKRNENLLEDLKKI